MKIEKLFEENAKKYGTVFCDGVEVALIENPYPEGSIYDWYFRASGMDKDGNLWDICWEHISDVDECVDYHSQVGDWDTPSYAELLVAEFFLDD